jgi:DNA-binding SARP family transcriptional activator
VFGCKMKIAMNPSSVALNVKLLGDVGILITEGKHIHFEADKRYQLLAYLAYDGGWLSREKLADLFWSDVSEVARQNLRKLLSRTQHLDWLVGLEVERNRVRWQVATDTATFQQALEASNIEQALAAYGGTFLKNLDSYEDTAFSSWLEIERERLHTQWRALSSAMLSHLMNKWRTTALPSC